MKKLNLKNLKLNRLKLSGLLLFTGLWTGVGLTQPQPARALTLPESEARMMTYHPLIQACAKNPQRAKALRAQASRWSTPRLNLVGEDLLGSATNSGQNYTQWTLEITQDIPLTGYKGALSALGEAESQAAQAQCQVLAQDLRKSLQGVYLETLYWQEQQSLHEEQVLLVKALRAGVARQIEQGKRPGVDLIRFDNEVEQAQLQWQAAQNAYALGLQKLQNFWPGHSTLDATNPLIDPLFWPTEREPLNTDPKTQAAQAEDKAARQELAAVSLQSLPDLTLGSGLRWHPESQDLGINVQMGWALPNLPAYADQVEAQTLKQAQTAQALHYAQLQLQQARHQTQQNLVQKQAQWERYQTDLLPRAEDYLQKVKQGLLLGKFTLLEVLEARRQAYTLKAEALRLRYEVAQLLQERHELGVSTVMP